MVDLEFYHDAKGKYPVKKSEWNYEKVIVGKKRIETKFVQNKNSEECMITDITPINKTKEVTITLPKELRYKEIKEVKITFNPSANKTESISVKPKFSYIVDFSTKATGGW